MKSPHHPFRSVTAAAVAFCVVSGLAIGALAAAETTPKEKAAPKATTQGTNVEAQEKKLTPPSAEPKKASGTAKKTESSAGVAPQVAPKKAGKASGITAVDDWEEPVKGAKAPVAPKAAPESVAPKAPAAPIAPKVAPKKKVTGGEQHGTGI